MMELLGEAATRRAEREREALLRDDWVRLDEVEKWIH